MKLKHNLALAWRSLRRSKLRSFLMMSGIMIGIAALTALASVGEATKQETLRQFKRMVGTFDMLSVRPGANATRGMPSLSSVEPTLRFDDVTPLTEVDGVLRVAPVQQAFDLEVVYRDKTIVPAVFGVSPNWGEIRGETVVSGASIDANDIDSLARVVVIGDEVRVNLFPDEDPIGKTLRIADVPFQVKGVFATRGAGPGGASLDNMVVIPVSTASRRLFNRDYLSALLDQIRY
jgi:putative ABC transport system permease protein